MAQTALRLAKRYTWTWEVAHSCRKLAVVISGLTSLRTHRVRLALWIAPALLFRALIPVGFMLEPIDGRAEIVVCAPADLNAAPHSGVHDSGHHHHHLHADAICPYAQSAGPAPLPALPLVAAAARAPVLFAQRDVPQINAPFGPTRQQSPRGPPIT
jgi:hypothetical protein